MTLARLWAVERTPNFVARSGTRVVATLMQGSCRVSSSKAEALHFGHSPAGT